MLSTSCVKTPIYPESNLKKNESDLPEKIQKIIDEYKLAKGKFLVLNVKKLFDSIVLLKSSLSLEQFLAIITEILSLNEQMEQDGFYLTIQSIAFIGKWNEDDILSPKWADFFSSLNRLFKFSVVEKHEVLKKLFYHEISMKSFEDIRDISEVASALNFYAAFSGKDIRNYYKIKNEFILGIPFRNMTEDLVVKTLDYLTNQKSFCYFSFNDAENLINIVDNRIRLPLESALLYCKRQYKMTSLDFIVLDQRWIEVLHWKLKKEKTANHKFILTFDEISIFLNLFIRLHKNTPSYFFWGQYFDPDKVFKESKKWAVGETLLFILYQYIPGLKKSNFETVVEKESLIKLLKEFVGVFQKNYEAIKKAFNFLCSYLQDGEAEMNPQSFYEALSIIDFSIFNSEDIKEEILFDLLQKAKVLEINYPLIKIFSTLRMFGCEACCRTVFNYLKHNYDEMSFEEIEYYFSMVPNFLQENHVIYQTKRVVFDLLLTLYTERDRLLAFKSDEYEFKEFIHNVINIFQIDSSWKDSGVDVLENYLCNNDLNLARDSIYINIIQVCLYGKELTTEFNIDVFSLMPLTLTRVHEYFNAIETDFDLGDLFNKNQADCLLEITKNNSLTIQDLLLFFKKINFREKLPPTHHAEALKMIIDRIHQERKPLSFFLVHYFCKIINSCASQINDTKSKNPETYFEISSKLSHILLTRYDFKIFFDKYEKHFDQRDTFIEEHFKKYFRSVERACLNFSISSKEILSQFKLNFLDACVNIILKMKKNFDDQVEGSNRFIEEYGVAIENNLFSHDEMGVKIDPQPYIEGKNNLLLEITKLAKDVDDSKWHVSKLISKLVDIRFDLKNETEIHVTKSDEFIFIVEETQNNPKNLAKFKL